MTFQLDRHLPADFAHHALCEDAREGLLADPKYLPARWCRDEQGAKLFAELTRQPEYYLARAEKTILSSKAAEISALAQADTLVELGAGAAERSRPLLDAMRDAGRLVRYVPVDINEQALRAGGEALAVDHPELEVRAVVADFAQHSDRLPREGRRLVTLLGGLFGGFEPDPRARLLRSLRESTGPDDTLLVGVDLVKSETLLLAAHDDEQGLTAAYHRNLLHVLNRELAADFDAEAFEHVVTWNAEREWVETRLRARTEQEVTLSELGVTVRFAAGEDLRTEITAKFQKDRVVSELADAGFAAKHWWTDPEGRFALSMSKPT
jgi:L-histidine Nalpha-methyltransferase